jgi:hypothetical protein
MYGKRHFSQLSRLVRWFLDTYGLHGNLGLLFIPSPCSLYIHGLRRHQQVVSDYYHSFINFKSTSLFTRSNCQFCLLLLLTQNDHPLPERRIIHGIAHNASFYHGIVNEINLRVYLSKNADSKMQTISAVHGTGLRSSRQVVVVARASRTGRPFLHIFQ